MSLYKTSPSLRKKKKKKKRKERSPLPKSAILTADHVRACSPAPTAIVVVIALTWSMFVALSGMVASFTGDLRPEGRGMGLKPSQAVS